MLERTTRSSRGVLVGVAVLVGLLTTGSPSLAGKDDEGNGKSPRGRAESQEKSIDSRTPARPDREPSSNQVNQAEGGRPGAQGTVTLPRDTSTGERSARSRPSWLQSVRQYESPNRPAGGDLQWRQRVSQTSAANRQSVDRESPYLRYRTTEDRAGKQLPYEDRRSQPNSGWTFTESKPRWTGEQADRAERPSVRFERPAVPVDTSGSVARKGRPGENAQNQREIRVPEPPARFDNRGREQLQRRERPTAPDNGRPPTDGKNQRRPQIPEANFRGLDAERQLKTLPRGEGQRVRDNLRDRVRQMNPKTGTGSQVRIVRDVVGNQVPGNAQRLSRAEFSRISTSYRRIQRDFGEPTYAYLMLPRRPADYWDGYWDGYADGYWAGRHYRHHPIVVINFYYPYYYSDPYWVAFWYAGFYPSVYHYWGWCPAWVYPQRVYYTPVEYVYVPVTPYRYYYTGYALDQVGAQRAIEDIRRAWFDSEIASLAYHLTDELDIQVYFDGEYEYTTATEDYYAMTVDAMATTQTVALDFDRPIWISSQEVFYTGRHVFYDPEGERQTVYVSYRLRRLGGEWYIVAVGSSLEPIRHHYHDFRYS